MDKFAQLANDESFISILQLNVQKNVYTHKHTQLSNGIRPHFTVDDEDWQCDTDAPLPFHHFGIRVHLFIKGDCRSIMLSEL